MSGVKGGFGSGMLLTTLLARSATVTSHGELQPRQARPRQTSTF